MARYLSEEDVRKEQLETFGSDLGNVFHALYNEVAWLHDKWREYYELFGTNPERIELLNQSAGRFFGSIQASLWEDILLHITRVTDSPKSAGKPTLTIRRLPDLIPDLVLREDASILINDAVTRAQFARDWRNRHIAHRDLQLALGHKTKALESASRLLVNEVLASIAQVLNRIHEDRRYFGGGRDWVSLDIKSV